MIIGNHQSEHGHIPSKFATVLTTRAVPSKSLMVRIKLRCSFDGYSPGCFISSATNTPMVVPTISGVTMIRRIPMRSELPLQSPKLIGRVYGGFIHCVGQFGTVEITVSRMDTGQIGGAWRIGHVIRQETVVHQPTYRGAANDGLE